MAISKSPVQCRGFEDFDFSVVDEATATNGCSPSFEDSGVLNARESSSLLEQVGADEDDRLGRGRRAAQLQRME